MLKYFLKRVVLLVPVIIGVSFIIFSIMNFTPGDPVAMMLGEGVPKEVVEETRERLGFNDPFIVRYFRFLVNAVQGDFGNSYQSKLPVFQEVIKRLPVTIRLAAISVGIAVILGLPIGIISAVKQYTIVDTSILGISLLLTSMPGFFLGLLLILIFSVNLGWLPMIGMNTLAAHIMPCIAASSATTAALIRMTRSTMLEAIRQDYIRTARAKGATENRVIYGHALRNSLLPVITVIGVNFGLALGGSVVIEQLFSIPGLGQYMINGMRQKDTPVVMACIMFAALLASIINLIVDLFYSTIDPRLKTQFITARKGRASI